MQENKFPSSYLPVMAFVWFSVLTTKNIERISTKNILRFHKCILRIFVLVFL